MKWAIVYFEGYDDNLVSEEVEAADFFAASEEAKKQDGVIVAVMPVKMMNRLQPKG
jgi:hypothetical protein